MRNGIVSAKGWDDLVPMEQAHLIEHYRIARRDAAENSSNMLGSMFGGGKK